MDINHQKVYQLFDNVYNNPYLNIEATKGNLIKRSNIMSYQTPDIDWEVKADQLTEVNYMNLENFENLIELLDISNSQRSNLHQAIQQVKKEFENMTKSQIPLFSIPQKIGSEIWFTVRSKTINNSMLCITDRWYRVRLGLRGKVEIDLDKWDKTKSEFYKMMF